MATETEDERAGVAEGSDKDRRGSASADNASTKSRERKVKKKISTKVIVRRLPPTMTEETFRQQVDPLPDHDFCYFVAADWSLGQYATTRAYIQFVDQADVFLFKDKFDGYVFVDTKGVEYPAIVEYAPFQGLPKLKARKVDSKAGTIDTDAAYVAFLAALSSESGADGAAAKPAETITKMEYSYQIKDVKMITTTPLLEFLANKQEQKREDRRRKQEDKKHQKNHRDDDKPKRNDLHETGDKHRSRHADNGRNRIGVMAKLHRLGGAIAEEDQLDQSDAVQVRSAKAAHKSARANLRDRARKAIDADAANSKDDKDAINRGRVEGARERRRDRRNRMRERIRADNCDSPAAEVKLLKPRRKDPPAGEKTDASYADVDAPSMADVKVKRISESRRKRIEARMEARSADGADANGEPKETTAAKPVKILSASRSTSSGGAASGRNAAGDQGSMSASATSLGRRASGDSAEPSNNAPLASATSLGRRASGDSAEPSNNPPPQTNSRDKAKYDRVRNKDRPTLQIYQPGRRRGADSERPSPDEANQQSPSNVPVKPAPAAFAGTGGEKRVSRYSERRNRQRLQKANDSQDLPANEL